MELYKRVVEFQKRQINAGVDKDIADLVNSYLRLEVEQGRAAEFYSEGFCDKGYGSKTANAEFLKKNASLDPQVQQFFVRYSRALLRKHLPVVFTKEHLSKKMRISIRELDWLTYAGEKKYRVSRISKKSGGTRVIHAPSEKLAKAQRWVLDRILIKQKVHKYATAFKRGSGLLENARPHQNRKVVVRMDMKDFFPSISFSRVRGLFQKLGYTYSVSSVFANICCVNGGLPQGAPTSPAISNLIAYNLDQRMEALKKKLGFRYSRYADDLIFSSNYERFPVLIPFLKEVIQSERFDVNESKTKIMRQNVRQSVTGVSVNEKSNISSKYYKELRAITHNIIKNGAPSELHRWNEKFDLNLNLCQFKSCLIGKIAHVSYLNPSKGEFLKKKLENAFPI